MNRHLAKRELLLQAAIADRAERDGLLASGQRITLMMDLVSLPDLDLEALLEAPPLDFNHDIAGILRHMDRSVFPGILTGCFEPRFSRPSMTMARVVKGD